MRDPINLPSSGRRWYRYFIPYESRQDFYLLYKLMSLLCLICVAAGAYIWYRNELSGVFFSQRIDPAKFDAVHEIGTTTIVAISICSALINGVGFIFVMRMLHHLNGPCLAIRKHLQEILEGKTASRCRMRKEDDLQDIGEMLNKIAELRQSKRGSQAGF